MRLDRHGGDVKRKMMYCYGLQDKVPVDGSGRFVAEDRGFGGTIVNSFSDNKDAFGGVDGGTGGCSCGWEYTPP